MFTHILVPTDGSPLSQSACDKAIEFARDIGAKVTILAVIEPYHVFSAASEQVAFTRDEYEKHAGMQVGEWLSHAELKARALGVNVLSLKVEDEHPHQVIVSTALTHGCDLIAMASHGRRGITALMLGSVTQKVLTHSKIPVLVYR